MKTTKLNWRKVWSEFDKLCDAADEFWMGDWKEQQIIFYAVVNKNLPNKKRLNLANILRIETEYKRWFRKEKGFVQWKHQQKHLMKLVNNEI